MAMAWPRLIGLNSFRHIPDKLKMKKTIKTPSLFLLAILCVSGFTPYEAVAAPTRYTKKYVRKKPAPVLTTSTATSTSTTSTLTTPDPLLTRVFSADSPWNTPIGPSPVIEPNSVAMMDLVKSYMLLGGYAPKIGLAYKQWTAPLHFIDSTTATKKTVYFDTASAGFHEGFHNSVDPTGIGEVPNVPLPSWVWPDPKADGHMILYDIATGMIYEFSRFRWSAGTAYATRVAIFEATSSGTQTPFDGSRWWMKNVRGSGMPFIGGLIRYSEFLSGEINHALSVSGPTNRLKKLSTDAWSKELCAPMAARSDGWEIGANTILEGARIQLNPNLDLDTLGLSADAKVVARALQTYGAFMADNAPAFNLYFENLGPNSANWEATGLGDLQNIPLSEFRVLQCGDIRTRL